jgi:hypothetical protein
MKKRILFAVAIVLLVAGAAGAFAETKSKTFPWMASYDKAGQLNVYAAAGFYGYGLEVNAGPEFMIQQFDLGGIPLSWGVTVRGVVGLDLFYNLGLSWGVGPMAALHWGVDFGKPWKFDWYVAMGIGVGSGYGLLPVGFATADGIAWHLTDKLAVIADYAYVGISTAGIGVKLTL